jgi:transposase
VTDALTSVLQDHRAAIVQHLKGAVSAAESGALTNPSAPEHRPDLDEKAEGDDMASTLPPTPADQRRQARAAEAHRLHAEGVLQKDIAQELNCHPKTVQRYLQRSLPLPARTTARMSKLDRYKPYLLQRWNAGCRNASQLLKEIQPRGFDGGCTILRTFVAKLREQSGMPARSRSAQGRVLTAADIQQVPSSRTLAWLSTQPKSALDAEQQIYQAKLVTVNTTLATAVELAQNFATMVRERQASALEGWLEEATECGIASMRSFANGIRADVGAVRAGLSVEWSNGRTEGSVNRLKCVKRQMYGRGKLDLLRLRLIGS